MGRPLSPNFAVLKEFLEEIETKIPDPTYSEPEKDQPTMNAILDRALEAHGAKALLEAIAGFTDIHLQKQAFVYLFLRDIADKQSAMFRLAMQFMTIDAKDVARYFPDTYPYLIKGMDDPNFPVIKAILLAQETDITESMFLDDIKEMAAVFLMNCVHQPDMLDFVLGLLRNEETARILYLGEALTKYALKEDYETGRINPTRRFSEAQMEALLETLITYIGFSRDEPDEHGYDRKTPSPYEAMRIISDTANPFGVPWLEKHLLERREEMIAEKRKQGFVDFYTEAE